MKTREPYSHFRPKRVASWWCTLDDILWPQKGVADRIKRRAEDFAEAGIDTAINFGFHIRFDFANYFGQLHGYLNNVCEELHKYDIRFLDHYSCNTIERPRSKAELIKMNTAQRHHILLHHDPIAAEYAGYAGYRFYDLCEVDVRDGSRGYSPSYQLELFCHNNPSFLEMHGKYLERLLNEVDLDGAQIDDMAHYAWMSTCACEHCLARFKRDYGHKLPAFGEKSFWGDTSGSAISWGNYENPVFRDWLSMKTDVIADHVKMIKSYFPDKPLTTCCSSTGPIILNAVSLDLEKLTDHLDLVMLENCGIGTGSVKWSKMDAEAMQQKDIAANMGGAPAIALSYMIYEKGGYMGWALGRFWGVVNWSSTLNGRLAEDPVDMLETHDIIGPYNNWEKTHSDLDGQAGHDLAEVRLVSSKFCRNNGWRDENGREHWDRVLGWSGAFVESNIGYRIVRTEELADAARLKQESTPLLLDGVACVSDAQFEAIKSFLQTDGTVWLGLPFGTHDERGFKRDHALSDELLELAATQGYAGLQLLESSASSVSEGEPTLTSSSLVSLQRLTAEGAFSPRIRQLSGDTGWAARLRMHEEGIVLHLMNRSLEAIPHPQLKDAHNHAVVLQDIRSLSTNNQLTYEIDFAGQGTAESWATVLLKSPELGAEAREVNVEKLSSTRARVSINLDGVDIYGVIG